MRVCVVSKLSVSKVIRDTVKAYSGRKRYVYRMNGMSLQRMYVECVTRIICMCLTHA